MFLSVPLDIQQNWADYPGFPATCISSKWA
jgi:hypothetical protein